MKNITESAFVKMCKQGIIGAILGIIAGILLGTCIYFLQFPLIWISSMDGKGELIYGNIMWQNATQPGMLGASVGAVIGAIFGSLFGLKEHGKK
jgi:hypothetical protein